MKPFVLSISFFCCIFVLVPAPKAEGLVPPKKTLQSALDQIEKFARIAQEEQGAPGLSIAITNRTGILRQISLGYANREARTPVTPATHFPIASITKSMTALLLLQLRDEGKFDLNAEISQYLPWFLMDTGGVPIYAHEVMSHTAGIPDGYSDTQDYFNTALNLKGAKTIFTPGTDFSYSNDGYALLGAVVDALEQRPWADRLQARVLDRLGMSDSSPIINPQTLRPAAMGYQFEDMSRVVPAFPRLVPNIMTDYVNSDGSVVSTPEDMTKYMRLILNGGVNDQGARVLSSDSYLKWTTADSMNGKPAGPADPQQFMPEAPNLYEHYGFGLGVHTENGDHIVGHTGGIGAYSSCMEIDVTRGFGVIAMSNLVEAPLHPCAIVLYAIRALQAEDAGDPLPSLRPSKGAYFNQTDIQNAGDYAGSFESPDGTKLIFSFRGSHLFLLEQVKPKPLFPRGDSTFYVDDPRFDIFGLTFSRNASGQVTEVSSGPRWFAGVHYVGPKTFSHPAAWDSLVGRYDTVDQVVVDRVFILKDALTLNGTSTLVAQADGTFKSGSSVVRFEPAVNGVAQRIWVDQVPLYRIEEP